MTVEPQPLELSPIVAPGTPWADADRGVLAGLGDIPDDAVVGLVDASMDSTTQRSHVVVDPGCDIALDELVVTAQRLADGSALHHYGVVVEVTGRIEGAELASDTARLAAATLPGERYRRAEVQWLRTVPERFLPPLSGASVWRAAGVHRDRALFLDRMDAGERLPLGLDLSGAPVYVAFSFINGDKGGHVSISGKSGVATKTSYALFLLYLLFETRYGAQVRGPGAAGDRAVVFSVKGEDLLHLDRPNTAFFADTDQAREAQVGWARLGLPEVGPFRHVRVYAPRSEEDERGTRVANVRTRDRRTVTIYGWTPWEFVRAGLLDYVFDDLDTGQLSFVEQVVRLQLLRYTYPLDGDSEGRVVLAEPAAVGEQVPMSWERARRRTRRPQPGSAGVVVEDFAGLVEFVADKVLDGPGFDPAWTGGVMPGTAQAFVRRLWGAEPRLRPLIAAGLTAVDRGAAISVVDVHALHEDAQRFVVGAVLASVWRDHESSAAAGKTWVLLDELNKYAPRQGRSPIKHLLVDIAGRGRSLGVLLLGAQQNPSGVDPNITGNAALHVVGQIRAQEAAELGFLPAEMRARAQLVAPGTMITSQPLIPAPISVRFPFPPYATRAAEVAADPARRAEARQLLEDM
ncbi:ATP-binding protein [Pseudonocardia sp.]|uniref:ATP-binding protein n=1 Tax=Pseudonocardia sp. TaxID=60912 RepID=UPI0026378EE8|nr:ATP-binding protein [Pseudonocardia sp.]